MTYLRRILHASTFIAVGVAGFFAAEAAAYVSAATAPVPPSITIPERSTYIKHVPVTEEAAVRIELENGLGSGVSIQGGFVLTAAHVVGDQKEVSVKPRHGDTVTAEVMWASKDYDIALLRTSATIPAANLSCRMAHVGEPISTVGNPLGMEFISTSGKIAGSARQFGDTWKSALVTDLTVIMGNSGGPVFAEDGSVVGIVVGVLGGPSAGDAKSYLGLSTVVPSSAVCALLGRVK